MKLIIDIPDDVYEDIEHGKGDYINYYINSLNWAVRNGIPYEDRPKGEWVLNKDENPECPFCHRSFTYWGNFCSNCGADLRGGKKDDTRGIYERDGL